MVIAAAGVAAAGIVTLAGKISGKDKEDTRPTDPSVDQPNQAAAASRALGLPE